MRKDSQMRWIKASLEARRSKTENPKHQLIHLGGRSQILWLSICELILNLISLMHSCRRRRWHPTPVLLPGKSHRQRSLVGCSPWGCEESDTTERLHFHFSLSCIGEGNGSPLQCSCLENPRDGGVWWAAVYGVAQSQTQLKRLSSSSSSMHSCKAQIFTLKATSHHSSSVWYVVFVLSFGSKYFLNSTTDFFSWAMLSLKY